LEDPKVLKGIMFNKDAVSLGETRPHIFNLCIILLYSMQKGKNMIDAILMKKNDQHDTNFVTPNILNYFLEDIIIIVVRLAL
jgi:hypothetical protein